MPVDLRTVPRRLHPTVCTVVGMVVNLALMVLKIVAGFVFRSAALVADGVHSLADLVSDLAVLLALRASRRPPDRDHPYGHEGFESLGAITVALFMLVTGVLIGRDAVIRLLEGGHLAPAWPALAVALVSVATKEWLARYTFAAARCTRSPALVSNAQMHRADALTSGAAAVGILGAMLGVRWLDSLGALIISLFVLREGWRLTQQNVLALLDTMPDRQTVGAMREAAARTAGVREVRDLKVRQRGAVFHADLRVAVDPHLSVERAHELAHAVEDVMCAEFRELSRVFVHVEPFEATMGAPPAISGAAQPDRRG